MTKTSNLDNQLLWRPSASIDILKQRAKFYAQIREFFTQREYLEVETPIMGHFGTTDIYLNNIQAKFRDSTYYLQTSPEYHMKRLLAADSGPIFQLARVFRDDELGRWHNPEFTLLEWYQLNINHHQLMDEVDAFLQLLLSSPPLIKKTYSQAFIEICDLDPFITSISELQKALRRFELENILAPNEQDIDQYLFLLMSHVIEPAFKNYNSPIAVYDFPISQAALAIINHNRAERFEIYFKGVELANGFHELCDPNLQALRFEEDLKKRSTMGLNLPLSDQLFLNALSHGLPPCSGVALGIDRLFALKLEQSNIANTMAFDFNRA